MSGTNQTPYAGLNASGSVLSVKSLSLMTLSEGSPVGVIAGQAGSMSLPPDMVWDWENSLLYVCTASGDITSTTWQQIAFYGTGEFNSLSLSGSLSVAGQTNLNGVVNITGGVSIPGLITTSSSGTSAPSGDSITTMDFRSGRVNIQRQTLTGDPIVPAFLVYYRNNSDQYVLQGYNEYLDNPAMLVQAESAVGSNGQVNGIKIDLYSYGNNPFQSEDQGINIQVHKGGQNSTWGISIASQDTTGLAPGSFAQVGQEIDINAAGLDAAATAYDPYQSKRVSLYLNGAPVVLPSWAANTPYSVGTAIYATPSGGSLSTFIAQNTGITGATHPTWPSSGTVTDGSGGTAITWAFGVNAAEFSIGRGIWFDSNVGGTNQYQWGTPISGDAICQNAFIDTCRVTFADNTGAVLRMTSNQYIDFTGNTTEAGKNNHVLTYSSFYDQLAYNIGAPGSQYTAFAIKDSGLVLIAGPVSVADTPYGALSGVTTGYQNSGLTVGYGYGGNGETDFMIDANGLNMYPITAGVPGSAIFAMNGAGALTISSTFTSTNMANRGYYADQSADVYTITGAGSRTIPNGCSWECFVQTGTQASFTTVMPAAPVDKQDLWISSRGSITAWTLSPNAGQSIDNAPTALAANASVHYRYNLATTTWFRLS